MEIDSPNAIGISTGFGIPTGGTTNQLLVKTGSTDYDTAWVSVINDQSSSDYIDIGNVRIQWGNDGTGNTGERTITFPVAFGNTDYSFVGTVTGINDVATRTVYSTDEKTTTFIKARVTAGGNGSGAAFQWMAIGQKPL